MHYFRDNRHNLINSLRKQGIFLIGYLAILGVVAWLCTEVWGKKYLVSIDLFYCGFINLPTHNSIAFSYFLQLSTIRQL